MKKRLRRPIAALLSVIIPGAGQLYNRQAAKAIWGYSAFLLIPVIYVVFSLFYYFEGLVSFIILLVGLYIWNITDALLYAENKHKTITAKRSYWIVIIPLILLVFDGYAVVKYSNSDTYTSNLGVRAIRLATNSMAPTMQVGDLFVTATNFEREENLQRGEIINFYHQGVNKFLFKRLIGLPGDIIEIKGSDVYVNGNKIEKPYIQQINRSNTGDFNSGHTKNNLEQTRIPGGKLFVMGDNRNNSFDSRDDEFGLIDIADVNMTYKPIYIYWSVDKDRIGRRIK